MLRRITLLACFCFLPLSVYAQEERTHDIAVDDYFTQRDVFDTAISPDGKYVAYTLSSWNKETDDRKTDLWLVEIATKKTRQLTSERAGDRSPQWSPDSKTIYFLANRSKEGAERPPFDGKTQVWRIGIDAKTPEPVTLMPRGVTGFEVAGDGKSVYFSTRLPTVHGPFAHLRRKYPHINYGHGITPFSALWSHDNATGRPTLILDLKRVIREFTVAPDGKRIAMITTPDAKVISNEGESEVDIFDVATRKTTRLPNKIFRKDVKSPYAWLEDLAISADGTMVAFNAIFDAYPNQVIIGELTSDGWQVCELQRPKGVSIKGYGSPLQWRGKRHDLCFLGEEKARVRCYCAHNVSKGRTKTMEVLTPGNIVVLGMNFNANHKRGSVIANHTKHLPDVYLVGDGKPERLTDANPQTKTWKLPQISIVKWKGANDEIVEGILELPPDYKKGQKIPLMLQIHGGPSTANYFQLRFWIYGRTLLPAKGIAVLSPNYRGSTGYGDKFQTDLVGKENDIEVEDMLKGVDAMIERGIADPDKLGVMGWSNGGYLTNCIITQTTRFRAAISGASILDAVLEFGANDEPAYTIVFKKGFPWTNPKGYHRASPTYKLDKIRTPTLIHVGANDVRCPPGHSKMLYRALKYYVKVPTELLIYPGEAHGLATYKNRRAKMEWDMAWLERYLLGTGK